MPNALTLTATLAPIAPLAMNSSGSNASGRKLAPRGAWKSGGAARVGWRPNMASRVLPLAQPRLTAQQIADLALSADQERRRAERAGRIADAAEHDSEVEKLLAAMRDAY